jgi:hypothetical protein
MRKHGGEVFGTVNRGDGRAAQIMESLGRLDLDNLKSETEETGAESIWFGEVAAKAKKVARDLKLAYDVARARAAEDVRRSAAPGGLRSGERITDSLIKEGADLNPLVHKAHAAWSQAEYEADLAESAKFALARKHEHLQHLTGLLSAELNARGLLTPRPNRTPI